MIATAELAWLLAFMGKQGGLRIAARREPQREASARNQGEARGERRTGEDESARHADAGTFLGEQKKGVQHEDFPGGQPS